MGDLKVTCSPAIYELFYEKVITEIIEVSERKKRIRANQQFCYHLPIILILCGILATDPSLNIALDRGRGGRGRDFRITSDTARGSVTWAEPLALFR